jgi:acetylornithine/succinyldiaminopimelate/putrescine aminotransferase
MDTDTRYRAHSYHPLPVVLSRGEGVFVWDGVRAAAALIDRAVARIQQLLGEMTPRRLAS